MTRHIQKMLEKITRWQVAAVLALPVFALFAIFNFHPAVVPALLKFGGGVAPLDLHLAYGPQEIASLFSTYGIDGRQRYAIFLVADLLFAVSYGLFFTVLLRLLLRPLAPLSSRWNLAALLPLLAAAADCVENISILVLLAIYPHIPVTLAYTASTATLSKWLLAGAAIGVILIIAVLRLVCQGRRRCVLSCRLA